jgi:hypothetical protein
MCFSATLRQHPWLALATAVYVGIPVGGFLSYFHRDDRAIEAEAAGRPVDYGRDAHWLDPFVYGALAYEIALVPRTPEVAISAAVVGMIVGVVAAGVSHFILSRWGNAPATIPAAKPVGAPSTAPVPDDGARRPAAGVAGARGMRTVMLLCRVLHIAATCTSLGGLFYARMVLWPTLPLLPEPERESFLRAAIRRYAYIKWSGVTVVAATGIVQWFYLWPHVIDRRLYVAFFFSRWRARSGC